MQRRLLQCIVSLSYDQLEDFVGRFRPPPPPIYSSIFTREATGRLLSHGCLILYLQLCLVKLKYAFLKFLPRLYKKAFLQDFVSVYLGVPNAPRSQIIEITLLLLQLKNFFLLTNRRYGHSCNGQHLHLNIERKDVPLPKSGDVSPCTKVVFP